SPSAQGRARQLEWDSSPLGAFDRWRSPVLLLHGGRDPNVDFSHSLLLARDPAARRTPYRELVRPNGRSAFFRHDSWLRAFRAVAILGADIAVDVEAALVIGAIGARAVHEIGVPQSEVAGIERVPDRAGGAEPHPFERRVPHLVSKHFGGGVEVEVAMHMAS